MINKWVKFINKFSLPISCLVLLFTIVTFFINQKNSEIPSETWKALLDAMQDEDFSQLERLSTEAGFASLMLSEDIQANKSFLRESARLWKSAEIEWIRIDDKTMEGRIGGQFSVNSFIFVRSSTKWKLDKWQGH